MLQRERILEATDDASHFVQLYGPDEASLTANVARYAIDGFASGSALLIVATPAHRDAFSKEIERSGWRTDLLEQTERLAWLDAEQTLARFMVDGYPDADRFDRIVGERVRGVLRRPGVRGLRAYGEMVGILWAQRQYPAAIRLEQLWNKLRSDTHFSLYCSYPVDVFGRDFDVGVLDALLCAHTHLMPCGINGDLHEAVDRALREVLGPDASPNVRAQEFGGRRAWAAIPKPEAVILWLRKNLPERADEVLDLARRYYCAAI